MQLLQSNKNKSGSNGKCPISSRDLVTEIIDSGPINVSLVVELQRWWILKSKVFGQESTYSKDFFFENWSMNYALSKSAKIVLLKSIFDIKNQPIFFKKKFT